MWGRHGQNTALFKGLADGLICSDIICDPLSTKKLVKEEL